MADAAAIPRKISPSAAVAVRRTMALAALVLLLMMVLGLALRLAQSNWVDVAPDLFYQIMTAHGVGMVAMAFGFSVWLAQGEKPAQSFVPMQQIIFLGYLVGGLGLVATFLYAGIISVPRRWACICPNGWRRTGWARSSPPSLCSRRQ